MKAALRANPAKVEDFGDKDLLQGNDWARILFDDVIPLRREARLSIKIDTGRSLHGTSSFSENLTLLPKFSLCGRFSASRRNR